MALAAKALLEILPQLYGRKPVEVVKAVEGLAKDIPDVEVATVLDRMRRGLVDAPEIPSDMDALMAARTGVPWSGRLLKGENNTSLMARDTSAFGPAYYGSPDIEHAKFFAGDIPVRSFLAKSDNPLVLSEDAYPWQQFISDVSESESFDKLAKGLQLTRQELFDRMADPYGPKELAMRARALRGYLEDEGRDAVMVQVPDEQASRTLSAIFGTRGNPSQAAILKRENVRFPSNRLTEAQLNDLLVALQRMV